MGLIIPGVEIRVIRELVPRPLGATGVLGIVGCTESDMSGRPLMALGSLQEFREAFGTASMAAMPEVRQAFAAGLNQVVVANVPPDKATVASSQEDVMVDAAPATVAFKTRAGGAWGNSVYVRVLSRSVPAGGDEMVEVHVFYPTPKKESLVEAFRNLSSRKGHDRYFVEVINRESGFIKAAVQTALGPTSKVVPANSDPEAMPTQLDGASDPMPTDFSVALARLESYPDVDMVTASHLYGEAEATQIYADILAHCERMSKIARNRVGFGQTIPTVGGVPDMQVTVRMASRLPSDRFVFVAPNGYMGSVIGMVAGLRYFESPTFKTLGGVSSLSFDFTDSNLIQLINGGVCAVDEVPRKGIAVVKGITTDAGQINVARVADRAVRHVQNIAQDFIGLLNTEAQRLALKQRITEAFTRMEKEGAIVPSTDGKSPAFAVTVESTPDDFAAGVVRIDTAVRPVRAIDYIYATIKVQAF
jgi:hypothetical protein